MGSAGQPSTIRFATFEVLLRSGELRNAGRPVRIQQLPLKLLLALLDHPGEVVTRDELRNLLWPGDSFGDFDQAVNAAIAKLRNALGDSADSPRFIETIPKRGYRFIAEIQIEYAETRSDDPLPPSSPQQTPPAPPAVAEPVPSRYRRRSVVLLVALALLLAGGIVFWKYQHSTSPGSRIRSVAVLPLENLSGDASQDYFADGMTDELITDLAQLRELRVISRTSVMMYKGTRKPLPQIARELNVDAILEGSVLRSGDQVRITAQLIRTPVEDHLWAESYEGDIRDTLSLQNRVSRAIAAQIRIQLTPQEEHELRNARAVDPQAFEDYLRGRYYWNKRTADGLEQAIVHFDRALSRDPNYAQAYSGLADTYALLGDWQYAVMPSSEALPRAKAAAIKAIALDSTLGDAHISLAFTLDGFDWDLQGGEREFQRGIELNPGYATAHHWYAWHLALFSRYDQALSEMRTAQSLDPLSLIINTDLAELLMIARHNDESIRQSLRAIEMDPDFAMAHNQLAQAYLIAHMADKAIPELKKAVELSGGSPACTANLARAYAAVGDRKNAVALMTSLKQRSQPGFTHAAEIAAVYAALGEKDQALQWLEKGAAEKFNPGVLIRPSFDSLRAEPRFKKLLARMGMPL